MKRILMAVALLLLCLACGGKKTVKEVKIDEVVKNLDNPKYVFVDNRDDSFYNGFKDKEAKRGGHIKGAVQFNCDIFDYIEEDKFESYVGAKGITKDKTVVFYGTDRDTLNCISGEFAARGYDARIFDGFKDYANDEKNPMESFPNFHISVSPDWINEVIQGKKPETYVNDKFMVFEVSWGPLEKSKTYTEHIPGAYHFDTDWVENAPIWNFSEPEVVKANLLKAGITANKTIILYSDDHSAAYRVFLALKWMGVKDVRVLNGNLARWKDKGYSVETKVNTPSPETDFGVANVPANPQYVVSMPEDAIKMQKEQGLKLISNRSWEEYIGEVSGYDYIPGKGEPMGAIWGFSGVDASNMSDYLDPDGTLRNPKEMFELWKTQNILRGDKLAFYCGTGWRANIPWFITQMAGWEDTYIYDGGWNAWQMDPKNPVQAGAPNNMKKPDSMNNYGKIEKKKNATCRG